MKKNSSQDVLERFPHLVFYDDVCPLCSKEINHYKSLDQCHPIEWIGIHANQKIINQFNLSKEELLRQIHVIRSDGVVVTGASAFATIWSALSRYKLVSKVVYRLKLISALNILYRYFAYWRYNKNYCQVT